MQREQNSAVEKSQTNIHTSFFSCPMCRQLVSKTKVKTIFQNVLANRLTLAEVETEYITEELCIISVRNNGLNIKYISLEYQTLKVCQEAYLNNPACISFIKNKKFINLFKN